MEVKGGSPPQTARMTQDLAAIFAELGMTQYLDAFFEQGFDSWDITLDITESDLDQLGVKLGHRRKLQRRIANARGIAPDAVLASPIRSSVEEPRLDPHRADHADRHGVQLEHAVQKRKYRRHPKPDENAPERPPSAYVLFSNKMREDLKGQNLTFTEIAKLVGENWQSISAEDKEPFERQAHLAKEKYNHELVEYKKTAEYRQYSQYLHEFKQKQASQSQGVSARKRTGPSCSLEYGAESDEPALTKRRYWKVKVTAKRPKLEPMRSSLQGNGSTTSVAATSGNGSGSGSLGSGGGSGSGSDSLPGSEPQPTRQERSSIISIADSQFSAVPPISRQQSTDEPLLSPSSTQFEPTSFVNSPRGNSTGSRSHRQWRDPGRGGPFDGSKPQQLLSFSDIVPDRPGMAVLPQSFDDSSRNNQYPSSHHRHRHDRPRTQGASIGRAQPPSLRHEQSSTGSSSSSSSTYTNLSSRSGKNASLPIHALLSSKSNNSPSPPLYSQPFTKPLEPEPRRPFSSHRTSSGAGQSSKGNGT